MHSLRSWRQGASPIFGVSKEMALTDEEPRTRKTTDVNIVRTLRNIRSYRSTVNELNRLSQRELADLGISRADIPAVASRAAF